MDNRMTIKQETHLTPEDMMINVLQTQKMHKSQITGLLEAKEDHERRITEIEDNQPINATLNNYITRIRNRRIVSFLGGKRSNAYKYEYPKNSRENYKTLANKMYKEAERSFKQQFDVRVYGELRQPQYEAAVKFWEEYEPSKELMREVAVINNQTALFA